MKNLTLYIFIVLLTACQDHNPYKCVINQSVISKNDSIMKAGDFNKKINQWLKRKNESRFESTSPKSYRLMISYSFDRDFWIYRIEQTNSGALLTIKKSYGEIYKKIKNLHDTIVTKELNKSQWDQIEKVFNSNCFWTLPMQINRYGLDGKTCVLEAFDPNLENPTAKKYFLAARWSPEKGTEFRKICDAITRLDNTKE